MHMRLFYRFVLIPAVLLTAISSCNQPSQKSLRFLKSNEKTLTYIVNRDTFENAWTITPDLKPDRLVVECANQENSVLFIRGSDTISFTVKQNDTIQFVILYNNDSALTEIVGAPKNTNFSDDYIRKHKGIFEVAVPEVHELANILVAISKIGQKDSNMVDMTTAYHGKVLMHFLPFSGHPVVDTINRHIKAVMDDQSYEYYYALK